MFFIGIIGIGNKNKKLDSVFFRCTGCIEEKFSLIELSKSFDIFFIPIFKFNKEYIIVCDNCKSIYKVKNDAISTIIEEKIVKYEDIENIILETNTCPYCGANISGNFSYCPKCGKLLKK